MIIVMRLPKRNKNLKENKMNQIKVSTRIILLFSAIICVSFISDYLHDFFGDFKCQGTGKFLKDSYTYEGCNYSARSVHDPTFHWGYRH